MFKGVNFLPTEFFSYLDKLNTRGLNHNKNYIINKLDYLVPSVSNVKYFGGIFCRNEHFHGVLIHQVKSKSYRIYFFNSLNSPNDEALYDEMYDLLSKFFQRKIRNIDDEFYIFKNHAKKIILKSTQQRDSFRCGYYAFLGK